MKKSSNPFFLLLVLTTSFLSMGASHVSQGPPIKNALSIKDKFSSEKSEAVKACILAREVPLNMSLRQGIADRIGWRHVPDSNLCHGYYEEPWLNFRAQGLVKERDTQITADAVSLSQAGRSTLKGDVQVLQPGKQLSANTAHIYRDPKTKRVVRVELFGDVELREAGRLVIGERGSYHLDSSAGELTDVIYRVALSQEQHRLGRLWQLYGTNGWGRAKKMIRHSDGNYQLTQVTYATCPPTDVSWQIEAKDLSIDNKEGRGVAKHAVFKVHDTPVAYLPYFSFPIDDRRKSGFLTPAYDYSTQNGYSMTLPFYWNIAPNYDATITPQYFSERGLMVGGEFRYLLPHSQGIFQGTYLPNDRAFADFIEETQALDPNLITASSDRSFFKMQNNTQLWGGWFFNLNYERVSDDYYFQDFSNDLVTSTENQLLQQARLGVNTEHWSFMSTVQAYQTLHPLNTTPVADAYSLYPQLLLTGHYTDLFLGINGQLLTQFDNFVWPVEWGGDNQPRYPRVDGMRFHANPILSRPLRTVWGYLLPTVQLQASYYDLNNNFASYYMPRIEAAATASMSEVLQREFAGLQTFSPVIPQFSLEGGVFFDRDISLFGHDYTQTLEPKFYYLYTPFVEQSDIPVFDSSYNIFTYDQLFRANRFSGFDRIGDANQLSLAVSSRILDPDTGREKFRFSVGDLIYFEDRRVQLCQSMPGAVCVDPPTSLGFVSPVVRYSPIVSQMLYALNPYWTIVGGWAWDPETRETNNGNLNFHYSPAPNHLLSLSYSFVLNGDTTMVGNNLPQSTNLHQITLSYAWPLNSHWSSFGAWSYNISHQFPMTYFAGLEYDSCCWALRLMGARVYKNLDALNQPVFSNSVFIQILLKGMGTVSSGDPERVMRSYLPAYNDIFK